MRQAARFTFYRGSVVRCERTSGTFTVDGLAGSWKSLEETKAAIDKAEEVAVSIPVYRKPGGWVEDGKVPDLEEVIYLGQDTKGHHHRSARIKVGETITTDSLEDLLPKTPATLAAWKEYKAARLAAYKAEQRAERLEEGLERFKPPVKVK